MAQNIPVQVSPASSLKHGRATVTVGGTRVRVVPDTEPANLAVLLVANPTNTSTLYLGGSAVTSSDGVPMPAGASVTLDLSVVGQLWAVGASAGDWIAWLYLA